MSLKLREQKEYGANFTQAEVGKALRLYEEAKKSNDRIVNGQQLSLTQKRAGQTAIIELHTLFTQKPQLAFEVERISGLPLTTETKTGVAQYDSTLMKVLAYGVRSSDIMDGVKKLCRGNVGVIGALQTNLDAEDEDVITAAKGLQQAKIKENLERGISLTMKDGKIIQRSFRDFYASWASMYSNLKSMVDRNENPKTKAMLPEINAGIAFIERRTDYDIAMLDLALAALQDDATREILYRSRKSGEPTDLQKIVSEDIEREEKLRIIASVLDRIIKKFNGVIAEGKVSSEVAERRWRLIRGNIETSRMKEEISENGPTRTEAQKADMEDSIKERKGLKTKANTALNLSLAQRSLETMAKLL